MAAIPQPTTVDPPAHMLAPAPVNPTAQVAQGLPGFDPEAVINAHEANLAAYLNQPVQDILSRLGLPRTPDAAPPSGTPNGESPAGGANPVDPTQMIQPVTDALGTLGSGQFNNNSDPTQVLQGISQALESAVEPIVQSLPQLASLWQGASASAAGAKTTAALADGTEVAQQSTGLGESLSSAVGSVQQAQASLLAIIDEFWAKIAAIGPSIIFPWGWAAAIQAATDAVSETTDVITGTQAALSVQARQAETIGAPVPVTAAPETGTLPIGPLVQMASGLAQPAMEGVSAISQVAQSGAKADPASPAPGSPAGAIPRSAETSVPPKAPGGAGAPMGSVGAGAPLRPQLGTPLLPRTASVPAVPETVEAPIDPAGARAAAGGMGAGPMGGGPMGHQGKAGSDGRYTAASFLHTSNDHIVGDLGSAAPPVIGQADPTERSEIDLRI